VSAGTSPFGYNRLVYLSGDLDEERGLKEQLARRRKPGIFRNRIKTDISVGILNQTQDEPSRDGKQEILNNIGRQRDYNKLTDHQITSEHEYLKFCLRKLNNDINAMLQARIAKAPRKSASIFISSRVSMKDINVFEQDIIKNEKIINALTYEARKLEIRRKEIEEPEMRLGLDGQLDSLRNAIRQADLDIKELKRKNIIR
jgi:hypothetical protein